ncbi:hypothetical protein DH2020_018022 [Rehmannia glutinosa]|uniref:Protein CHUP1, chloroplastic-like n=1 Tax=Rehmannia glutinosa TaxID=99300 RepID=A0ABR0WIX7_REHGL
MESSSSSKMEIMKPVFLKAGIPLAVTLAGFILAKIATRKSSLPKASSQPSKNQVNIINQEKESCDIYADKLQEELLGLKSKIQDFQDLKDQEIVLMGFENKLMLEINKIEFLEREISLLEGEKQRFDNIKVEYLEILRLLEFSSSENQKLHKRVKKLLKKNRVHCMILRKKSLQIEFKERKILKYETEIESKDDCIKLMEDEIREMKPLTELLQMEKNEISCKLRVQGEMVTIENYNQLACELDRLQKDEAAEIKELIYLRWQNACLRHELMMRNQEQEQNNFGGIAEIEEFGLDNEINRNNVGQDESYILGLTTQNHVHSKRRKLIEKLRKWVEGGEKEKHGKNKCFRRRSVSDGAEDGYFPARKSCSSA